MTGNDLLIVMDFGGHVNEQLIDDVLNSFHAKDIWPEVVS